MKQIENTKEKNRICENEINMPFGQKSKDSGREQEKIQQADENFFSRLRHALGPLVPGFFIDLVDLITFGPTGLFLGLFLGAGAGYMIVSKTDLTFKQKMAGAAIAGTYCTMPFTGFLPVGTLIAAWARFHEKPDHK
ncbi:hypothetical protein QUF76_07905 [Desulfobacterales bacterium HSG16]|nr:hypothetical protein [Desulfobacterales bacterium HSG16]